MKKILLIADAIGWIFHRHCDEIKKRMTEYDFDVKFTWASNPNAYDYSSYDLIYQLDPMGIAGLNPPKAKTIIGLRNEFMYDHSKAGVIGFFKSFFEPRCCMFHVVNKNQMKEFSSIPLSIPLLLCQHGIDTDCFRPKVKELNKKFPLIVGTSGSATSSGEKGFEIVMEACKRTGCNPLTAKQNLGGNQLTKEQMPSYYNQIDIYCCMSKTEGLNNCVMEAGSTGTPVITTRTGAVEEMIVNGESGFIIERNVDALVGKIKFFQENRNAIKVFGDKFMKTIRESWSWDVKINDYREMFNKFFELKNIH